MGISGVPPELALAFAPAAAASGFFVFRAIAARMTGRYQDFWRNLEEVGFIALMLAAPYAMFAAGNALVLQYLGQRVGVADIPAAWTKLPEAADKWAAVGHGAWSWIFSIASIRAGLVISQILAPMADVINDATAPAQSWFWTVVVTAGLFKAFCTVLGWVQHLMLGVGATLVAVPRARRLGAWLLSAYMVLGPSMVGLAYWAYDYTERLRSLDQELLNALSGFVWGAIDFGPICDEAASVIVWSGFGAALAIVTWMTASLLLDGFIEAVRPV